MEVAFACTLYYGNIYQLLNCVFYNHDKTAASIIWEMKTVLYVVTSLAILMEYFFREMEGGLQREWSSLEAVSLCLEHA